MSKPQPDDEFHAPTRVQDSFVVGESHLLYKPTGQLFVVADFAEGVGEDAETAILLIEEDTGFQYYVTGSQLDPDFWEL
jgi:hypothetical protein